MNPTRQARALSPSIPQTRDPTEFVDTVLGYIKGSPLSEYRLVGECLAGRGFAGSTPYERHVDLKTMHRNIVFARYDDGEFRCDRAAGDEQVDLIAEAESAFKSVLDAGLVERLNSAGTPNLTLQFQKTSEKEGTISVFRR